ncbi:hypothetical protein KL909_004745 [Ogataea angusta]|nr:hypothetical protein KL909_004745 [Ogataea angusta]
MSRMRLSSGRCCGLAASLAYTSSTTLNLELRPGSSPLKNSDPIKYPTKLGITELMRPSLRSSCRATSDVRKSFVNTSLKSSFDSRSLIRPPKFSSNLYSTGVNFQWAYNSPNKTPNGPAGTNKLMPRNDGSEELQTSKNALQVLQTEHHQRDAQDDLRLVLELHLEQGKTPVLVPFADERVVAQHKQGFPLKDGHGERNGNEQRRQRRADRQMDKPCGERRGH